MTRSRSPLLLAASIFLMSACATAPQTPRPDALVSTTSGTLQGASVEGVDVYRGVPFAAPPVGELRWKAPQPMSWDGVYQATQDKPACVQPLSKDGSPNGGGYAGPVSEDCLYMNIWAPEDAENAPIMLFLFGGGGVVGAGNVPTYDGSAFARDGVVLVTINYRLGALAGFAHPSLTAEASAEPSSNFHLLDAIAALEWMKANAASFGGDAENILLFGESAGATMTANLVASPMTEGLFQKAIFESTGSLGAPATPLALAHERGAKLASDLGLDGAAATPEELRALDADAIISHRALGRGQRTILDGEVMETAIMDTFAAGHENDVMLVVGTNSDEGRLTGTKQVAEYAEDGAPVWQYFFDYVANDLREANPNGAPHAHELPFVFDTLEKYPRVKAKTADDQAAADLAHSCWVAFAKAPLDATALICSDGFVWPSRNAQNDHVVAVLQSTPSLKPVAEIKSPPNGAEPGPTSRDD
ncbi:carboxylesterase family protein [Henriciella litoralis]|uniref:carboxylesterase family protein n=1 Tax=Henriciella litoralis TaxID=568102 RepID=UPI000A047F0E|nr:carboxylesterase family protein [Henriciella litoralis]